ncbi:hypothetical protein GPECTOR_315g10 [Gonium pectorale]|uniref:Methyltransferase small domain-containing protein n=1 Tax=Gonium pectorale TaxID=33097 RepID=A0A150FVT7_GONPE|nr:hypothetical protein GPECTOR_315g10 [Gonium pectorale]|eukprot:KXZ41697.1 hypothetical protein GPECTOR_315g10 [Gonium pectorale]
MRPAVHLDELPSALAWKSDMAARIAELGDTWEREDGGPDAAGLLAIEESQVVPIGRDCLPVPRELDWVLDDAIEAFRTRPDADWEPSSWRMLEPLARGEAARGRGLGGWQLRMRAPVAALREWWERRLRDRVPFQYLISSAHWHTYVLSVGPGVLIPRPETEIFPLLVAEALRRSPALAAAPWADLGTGSGAIAVAAADVLRGSNPSAVVWAVDVSPAALAYAQFNAQLVLGGSPDGAVAAASSSAGGAATAADAAGGRCPHVRVVRGSWFDPLLAAGLRGRLGGLLSNPPYIPRCQMAGLQAEVGRHEPAGALDGGEGHGLDSLQELCSRAAEMLVPGGLIALETAGGEQADLVAELLRRSGPDPTGALSQSGDAACDGREGAGCATSAFEAVEVLEDCYGVRRFVRAYRSGGA